MSYTREDMAYYIRIFTFVKQIIENISHKAVRFPPGCQVVVFRFFIEEQKKQMHKHLLLFMARVTRLEASVPAGTSYSRIAVQPAMPDSPPGCRI